MAEQKIEDTKSPAARRGARPFAGPAGVPSAARPLLRPAATPGVRPTHAPFAPPSSSRQALGIDLIAPHAPASPPPAVSVTAVATPAAVPAAFDVLVTAKTDELPVVVESVDSPVSVPARRPVTSEMVALDAVDAFEAVWSTPGIGTSDVPPSVGSPLDAEALGSVDAPHPWAEDITASPDTTASLVTDPVLPLPDASVRNTPDIAMPAWLVEPTVETTIETAAAAPAWPASEESDRLDIDWSDAPTIPSADDVMAAEPSAVEALGEAIATSPVADEPVIAWPAVPNAAAAEPWPDPLLAEYAPYLNAPAAIPAPAIAAAFELPVAEIAETQPILHDAMAIDASAAAPASTFEILDDPVATADDVVVALAPTDARSESGRRVSAALGRLAERVRDGEIDVSFVAPEATDAAVLASVLAALLGGSTSR